jgi:hypothetical protein
MTVTSERHSATGTSTAHQPLYSSVIDVDEMIDAKVAARHRATEENSVLLVQQRENGNNQKSKASTNVSGSFFKAGSKRETKNLTWRNVNIVLVRNAC